jgi:xylulokinase
MDKKYFIGIDCGTQSVRAILFDLHGNIFSQSQLKLDILTKNPGWAEQDAQTWWSTLTNVLRRLTQTVNASNIAGMGIAYQRESLVVLDAKNEEIRPAILWLDQRAVHEVEEAKTDLGGEYFRTTTGKFLDTTPSLLKLKWIQNREPQNYKKINKILDVGAYLHWKLTANMSIPIAGADTLGILDMASREWSDHLLAYLNLSNEIMPDLIHSGKVVGEVTDQAARDTGLPAGLPVVAAGGDGQVFAIGVNSIANDQVALTMGTGIAWGVHSKIYKNSPFFRSMIGCMPDTYYFESVLRAGAHIISWFVDEMGGDEREVARRLMIRPELLLERQIANIPPGCEGLLTIPYWKGGMMPYNDPQARGLSIGWSDYHTKSHFYRSILEGIAFEIRLVLEGSEQALGILPGVLSVGSGGAESKAWAQIISDVTGKKLIVSKTTENTALGAAMIVAWGLGYYNTLNEASEKMYKAGTTYMPAADNHEVYSQLFQSVYKKLYPSIRDSINIIGNWALENNISTD